MKDQNERRSAPQVFFNDDPKRLQEWIETQTWPCVDFVTYAFAGKKFFDDRDGNRLDDDRIISKMILYYQRLARESKKSIFPLLFVSNKVNQLHFHSIEFSTGIKNEDRDKTWRRHWNKHLFQGQNLPKNLFDSIIDVKPYDKKKGAVFYSSSKHLQMETSLFEPRSKRHKVGCRFMGKLDYSLKAHHGVIGQNASYFLSSLSI